MAKKVKRPVGRPVGWTGEYVSKHVRREYVPIRLPNWMKIRLRNRKEPASKYIERLILNDTGWKEPLK